MDYTVTQLSKLSKVSARTLHFYDEIGLLKPAYRSKGYRYYQERELLQLQQILFFKELGFSLKQIQKVVGQNDFDQLAALYSHQKSLSQEWEKIGKLLKTIDKTIQHLKGKKKMKDQEVFDGFNITIIAKAKGSESYFNAESVVLKSVRNPATEKKEKEFYENLTNKIGVIFKDLIDCINKGLNPTSSQVQKIIKRHHDFIQEFHFATKEVYNALAQLYVEHPDYKKQLAQYHAKLPAFIAQAMKAFTDSKLS